MKLHRYVDHQMLHIVTKDVISLSILVLLLFRHYISHKITFGAPSSGGVLRSACGAFIWFSETKQSFENGFGFPNDQKYPRYPLVFKLNVTLARPLRLVILYFFKWKILSEDRRLCLHDSK